MTDQELRDKTQEFRERIEGGVGKTSLIPDVFAVAREVMDRNVGIRNIFNPEHGFDPSTLPDDARRLFDETKAAIDAMEDGQPVGDLLGNVHPVPTWLLVDIPVRLCEAVKLYPESRPHSQPGRSTCRSSARSSSTRAASPR